MTAFSFNEYETPKPDLDEDRPEHPDVGARKGEGKMSDEELKRIMHGLLSDASILVDGELSPLRAEATDYYLGKPFGNEEDGRSQIVLTEVRDVVHGTLPSLLRVFFGPERCVEFVPRDAVDPNLIQKRVANAQQATDYVQYVFVEDNEGFLRTREVLLDGLIRKLGIFKWWWDPGVARSDTAEDLSLEDTLELLSRTDINVISVVDSEYGDDDEEDADEAGDDDELSPKAGAQDKPDANADDDDAAGGKRYTVEYTTPAEGRVRIEALPPEEFLFNRLARGPYVATLIAHRTDLPKGDLIAMGVPEDVLDAHGGFNSDPVLRTNVEAIERNVISQGIIGDPDSGESNILVRYVESFVRLDYNGTGESELMKVCTVGPEYFPVGDPEPVDEIPFAIFCPYPEPHTMLGQSMADLTMDIQRSKSFVARAVLDSLALSIFPRTTVVEGAATIEDVLNNEIGAVIRMKRDGAVQALAHPFTGAGAMPILEYFDAVLESRTGRDKGAMGLDADALQSSTKQAVNAAVTASQEQIEMICRLFAEQTLKPMFRGVYKLLVKHKPKARLMKLRGTYVNIDTSSWDAEMDVTVNVAMGISQTDERIAALTSIAQKQEEILQMLGPDNPIVSVPQLRETYARIIELSGFKDVSAFLKPIDPNWQPPAPQAPPPTPEQVTAQTNLQIEQMRTQKDLQIKQAELELKKQAQEFDQMLQVRKSAMDFTLRRYAIDAQFHADYTQGNLEADAAAEAQALEGALAVRSQVASEQESQRSHALAAQDQAHDQALARNAQAHSQAMDQTAAAQAAAQPSAGAQPAAPQAGE